MTNLDKILLRIEIRANLARIVINRMAGHTLDESNDSFDQIFQDLLDSQPVITKGLFRYMGGTEHLKFIGKDGNKVIINNIFKD